MLSTVVYTCTRTLPILDIFKVYWKKNTSAIIPTNIVSNNFDGYDNMKDGFRYIGANIEFNQDGLHFRETMLHGLNQISDEYILFLLDDYIFLGIDWYRIEKLVLYMKKYNVDFCNLSSLADHLMNKLQRPDAELGITDDWVCEVPSTFQYRYSVQAGIWKRESLVKLIELNDDITLHLLDTTALRNDPALSVIGTNKKNNGSAGFWNPLDYIAHYIEIIRWGFFNELESTYTVPFIVELMNEFSITLDDGCKYKKFIYPGSDLYARKLAVSKRSS